MAYRGRGDVAYSWSTPDSKPMHALAGDRGVGDHGAFLALIEADPPDVHPAIWRPGRAPGPQVRPRPSVGADPVRADIGCGDAKRLRFLMAPPQQRLLLRRRNTAV